MSASSDFEYTAIRALVSEVARRHSNGMNPPKGVLRWDDVFDKEVTIYYPDGSPRLNPACILAIPASKVLWDCKWNACIRINQFAYYVFKAGDYPLSKA